MYFKTFQKMMASFVITVSLAFLAASMTPANASDEEKKPEVKKNLKGGTGAPEFVEGDMQEEVNKVQAGAPKNTEDPEIPGNLKDGFTFVSGLGAIHTTELEKEMILFGEKSVVARGFSYCNDYFQPTVILERFLSAHEHLKRVWETCSPTELMLRMAHAVGNKASVAAYMAFSVAETKMALMAATLYVWSEFIKSIEFDDNDASGIPSKQEPSNDADREKNDAFTTFCWAMTGLPALANAAIVTQLVDSTILGEGTGSSMALIVYTATFASSAYLTLRYDRHTFPRFLFYWPGGKLNYTLSLLQGLVHSTIYLNFANYGLQIHPFRYFHYMTLFVSKFMEDSVSARLNNFRLYNRATGFTKDAYNWVSSWFGSSKKEKED